MKRIVLAVAAFATLTASAPAHAGGFEQILGGIAQEVVGQALNGAMGSGRQSHRQSYREESSFQEPYYGDGGYRDQGTDVFDEYDRHSQGLSDQFGSRKVGRCGRDAECAEMAVRLLENRDGRRLALLFRKIK